MFKNKRAVKDSEKGRELQILAFKEYERIAEGKKIGGRLEGVCLTGPD